MSDQNEALWKWLKTAPLPVVLTICLSTTGALAGWVWAVADDLANQRAIVAVAAEQARTAKENQAKLETQLSEFDKKIDKVLAAIVELKTAERVRAAKENSR